MLRLLRLLACSCLGAGVVGGAEISEAPDFLRWRRYEPPAFPAELHPTAVRDGFATVVFTFDDAGRITDRLVIAASHPAFTASVIAATLQWEVDPTGLAPSLRRETARFEFVRRNAIVSMTQRDASKAAFSIYGDAAAVALETFREDVIDATLKISTGAKPDYPAALRAAGTEGHATISFIVDGEGRVRVPVIASATHADFGAVTLAALRQWRFAPGRRTGKIVQVIAERTVSFRLPDAKK